MGVRRPKNSSLLDFDWDWLLTLRPKIENWVKLGVLAVNYNLIEYLEMTLKCQKYLPNLLGSVTNQFLTLF